MNFVKKAPKGQKRREVLKLFTHGIVTHPQLRICVYKMGLMDILDRLIPCQDAEGFFTGGFPKTYIYTTF